jgi:hypothetical protein
VNVTRKITRPISRASARLIVNSYSTWCVESVPADIATAFRIEDEARIGFWDALIVASAVKSGATQILSEDLNPGQVIAGIRIVSNFAKTNRDPDLPRGNRGDGRVKLDNVPGLEYRSYHPTRSSMLLRRKR